MLSVVQTIVLNDRMNNELESIWKEVDVTSLHFLGGTAESNKKPVRKAGFETNI
jgi:hypothetical protein